MSTNKRVLAICLSLLGLCGAVIILYCTRWGAALSDDSFNYIYPARSFLNGTRFDASTHFPPLLPLVLTILGLATVEPLEAIRWLNAGLFAINIFLYGWILFRQTGSAWFSLIGSSFFLVCSNLIEIHSWAMSEPLYLFLMLLGCLGFMQSNTGKDPKGALFSGLLFGLSAVTRYIGVSLIAAGALAWLVQAGTAWRERWRHVAWFGAIAVAPSFLWVLRNQILTGSLTSRSLAWHPMPLSQLWEAWNVILLWVFPGRMVNDYLLEWLVAAGAVLFLGMLWVVWRLPHQLHDALDRLYHQPLPLLIALSAISYCMTLWFSRTLYDPHIPTDKRLLSPLLIFTSLLLFLLLEALWRRQHRLIRAGIIFFLMALLAVNLTRSLQTVQSYHAMGRGYASERDHISEIYAYVRKHPDIQIYSNAWVSLYFWTGRLTYPIPASSEVNHMKSEMQRSGAFLIIFDSIPVELYGVSQQELTAGLVEHIRLSEGTIYRVP